MLKEPMIMKEIKDAATRYYSDDYVIARPIIDGYECCYTDCDADIFLAPNNIYACTNHHAQGEAHEACDGEGCEACGYTAWQSYPLVARHATPQPS